MKQESPLLFHASPKIGGLLLAGGRGRRFDPTGHQHKLLARLPCGQTLVSVSAQRLLPWVSSLTVVVGPHNVGVTRELVGLPVHIVVCEDADQGLGATLRCGLSRASLIARPEGWLVALADMPYIADSTYALMRKRLTESLALTQNVVWRPTYADLPGHPVVVSASLADRFLASQSESSKGLSVLWHEETGLLQCQKVQDQGCVRDIDRPEDLFR